VDDNRLINENPKKCGKKGKKKLLNSFIPRARGGHTPLPPTLLHISGTVGEKRYILVVKNTKFSNCRFPAPKYIVLFLLMKISSLKCFEFPGLHLQILAESFRYATDTPFIPHKPAKHKSD